MWPRLQHCARAIKPLREGFVAEWGVFSLSRKVTTKKLMYMSPLVQKIGTDAGLGYQYLVEQKIKLLEAQLDRQAQAVVELQSNVLYLLQNEHKRHQHVNPTSSREPSPVQRNIGLHDNWNGTTKGLEDLNLGAQLDRIESKISHLQKQTTAAHKSTSVRRTRLDKSSRWSSNKGRRRLAAIDKTVDRLSDLLKGIEQSLGNEQTVKNKLMGSTMARLEAMEALLHLQESRILPGKSGVVRVNNCATASMAMWPSHTDSRYSSPMYASASLWSLPTVLAEALGMPDGAWNVELDEDDVLLNYLIYMGVPGALLYASREVVDDQAFFNTKFVECLISWVEYECHKLVPSFTSEPQPKQQYYGVNPSGFMDTSVSTLTVQQDTNESAKKEFGGARGSNFDEETTNSEINASQDGTPKKSNDNRTSAIEYSSLDSCSHATNLADREQNSQQVSPSPGCHELKRVPPVQSDSFPQIATTSGDSPQLDSVRAPFPSENSGCISSAAETQVDAGPCPRSNSANEMLPDVQVEHVPPGNAPFCKSRSPAASKSNSSLYHSNQSNKDVCSKPTESSSSSKEKQTVGSRTGALSNPSEVNDNREVNNTTADSGDRALLSGHRELVDGTPSALQSDVKSTTDNRPRRAKSCGNWPFPCVVQRPNRLSMGKSDKIQCQFEISGRQTNIFEPIERQTCFPGGKKKKNSTHCTFGAEQILGGQRVGSVCDHPEAVFIDNPLFGKKWASSKYEVGLGETASVRTNPLYEDDSQTSGIKHEIHVYRGDGCDGENTELGNDEWLFHSRLQAARTMSTLRL